MGNAKGVRGLAVAVLMLAVALAGCTAPSTSGQADDTDETARLREQIQALSDRIASLEARLAAQGPTFSSGITFDDVTDEAGITYSRTTSDTMAIADRIRGQDRISRLDKPRFPFKPDGAPGVAILDFDRDGDLDIFVPNGPGQAHSLYSSQLQETGQLTFDDVAQPAGVAAVDQDGTGTCFGDTDNDGDPDLLVLSWTGDHRFFTNDGDGTFTDATAQAGLTGGRGSASCSMGDVDGDGLLDVAVANSFNWTSMMAIMSVPFALSTPNQLFQNVGDNRFRDISQPSGIQDLTGIPDGNGTITWAIALVDHDRDGDLDLVHADDQAGIRIEEVGGTDRGYIRILENDGTGTFTDVTLQAGTDVPGDWMGLAFADLNRDGHLDFFGSNFGDYVHDPRSSYQRGDHASDWFLARPDASYRRPGVGRLSATPFGWGVSTFDYDNDADTDLVFHGGMSMVPFGVQDNPGALLNNQGHLGFALDDQGLQRNHTRRGVEGVATGDLDGDLFPDIVSAAGYRVPEEHPLERYPLDFGGPFDETAMAFWPFQPVEGAHAWQGPWNWTGMEYDRGDLAVEVNSADNGMAAIQVRTLGAAGLIPGATVNRDGIGAVVTVTPAGSRPATQPVVGGASYASQDALAKTFGLGVADNATVEVLWPGGDRNRLEDVQAGQTLVFPEIPCSFDTTTMSRSQYEDCVTDALDGLVDEGVLDAEMRGRFKASAMRAYGAE